MIPVTDLTNWVMIPFLPSSKIQEYAPINGAEIMHMTIRIWTKRDPRILYIVNRYAIGIAMISDKAIVANETLKLFQIESV